MNNSKFQYSVLKYRHSILLNELVNVGLLFYFPEKLQLEFIFPNKLNRISHLYLNLDINTIKTIQNIFESKCVELNEQWLVNSNSIFLQIEEKPDLGELIGKHFLPEDSSSLFFDKVRTGVDIGVNSIISHYKNEYFSCYDDVVSHHHKKDEKYLEHQLRNQLKNKISDIHKIEVNKEITVGHFSEKFKWGWKNGTENLIAPIGFDLLEPETIKQKAISWYGKLSYFSEYAESHNISFHILTSKPTSSKPLAKAYENALKIIGKADAPKKIVEEGEIVDYSNYLAANISN